MCLFTMCTAHVLDTFTQCLGVSVDYEVPVLFKWFCLVFVSNVWFLVFIVLVSCLETILGI